MKIKGREDAEELVKDWLKRYEHEVFGAVYLDNDWNIIEQVIHAEGDENCCEVPIRDVVFKAISSNAFAVILTHNHPGGKQEPSQADILVTRNLGMVLAILGIALVDHLFLADGKVFGIDMMKFAANHLANETPQ